MNGWMGDKIHLAHVIILCNVAPTNGADFIGSFASNGFVINVHSGLSLLCLVHDIHISHNKVVVEVVCIWLILLE